MTAGWTAEQIIKLAPDTSSASAGKGLAAKQKWVTLGVNDLVAWGECQGSGKNPYQTEIFLEEPAFHCTCPSRKFPCKHSLGLFLLLVDSPGAFNRPTDSPAWVTEWLAKRQKMQEKAAEAAVAPPKAKTVDKAQQDKRADQRQAKVTAGLEDLQVWLGDLVRGGLATAKGQPYKYWDGMAARMVDAQAPGVARRLREMGGIASSGSGWQERLLDKLGQLHLLLEGYRRLDELPPDLQAEVRTQVGWTQNQDELAQAEGIKDRWLVVGQDFDKDDKGLKTRVTWLWGSNSGRAAMVLDFAYGSQSFEKTLPLGGCLEGEVVFFPGTFPLRALVKPNARNHSSFEDKAGLTNLDEVLEGYSRALGENPWLEDYPVALANVYPARSEEEWQIRDETGRWLPLDLEDEKGWQLMALSGGYPLGVFGLWNGRDFNIYGAWVDGRFFDMALHIYKF